eukprot:s7675_g1.t1
MKHVWEPDCMSLVEHLNAEVPKKVSDKRLGIELAALRQSLWTGNSQRSSHEYSPYGDALWWAETAKMLADALTKSMRPHYLVFSLPSVQQWMSVQREQWDEMLEKKGNLLASPK